jgi:uncharacterized repeat protein (TIGR03833 family)
LLNFGKYFQLNIITMANYKNGSNRSDLKKGMLVAVVQKQHQSTGELTEGIIERILTKSSHHPHGIKVKLASGKVGRVKEILDEEDEF